MAHLSDLSIGFIVGGSVIFVSIILGFIAWKIIDSKRHAKPVDANPGTGQSRVETGAANDDVVDRPNARDSRTTGPVYTEIHVVDVHGRTTANTSTFSRTGERTGIATNDTTDDSGYCEGQLSVGCSEVYSRLHEVHIPMQNVYNDFTDEDSGHGSHWRMNSVSANSDDEDGHDYELVTPTRKASSQTDEGDVETTPRRETLVEEDEENDYVCPLPRVDIIQVRRPFVYEPVVEIDRNLYSVSANSDDEDAHDYQLATPTRKASNQTDQGDVETTLRRETLVQEDEENDYSRPLPRVDIIEVRRPVVSEPQVEIDKNLYSERDDTSTASRDCDEVSVQDTPF